MTTGDEASGDSVPGDSVDASEGAWWAVLGAGGSLIVVLVIGAIILGAGLGDSDSDQLGASSPADSSVAADDSDDSGGSSGDVLTLGEEVYGTTCVSCHGQQGEGGVGPAFAGVVERLPDVGDHMEIVRTGRGTMPSFGPSLSDAEIEAVVAYEREVLDAG